ncbi:MAG: 6-carboxytetrahydropterin synthase [Salinivirgaceae bacterium]|nr:6-carboxytetrahydropterin synthase [Salinivirgaceae bacterium]
MKTIRVTKEFNFEMAHALMNYDGFCKNVHGHSYKMFVTVIGTPSTNMEDPKLGMLIDFGDLKKIVNKEIVDVYDHAFLLNKNSGVNYNSETHQMFSNTIYVDYQPTCENMVNDFAEKIKAKLPEKAKIFSIRLYETATAYAEWFASDNL